MKIEAFAAIAVLGIAVSGCATIVEGTTQSVSVTTTPEQGAQCTLVNSQGTWYLTTPGSTTVHKTKTDLNVTCNKEGFGLGQTVAASHFGAATAGNVIAGGLVGMGVDAASGANLSLRQPYRRDAWPSHDGASRPRRLPFTFCICDEFVPAGRPDPAA